MEDGAKPRRHGLRILHSSFRILRSPSVSRGLAAFLGGFTLLNLAGGLFSRGFDCNVWWVDLRPLPPGLATAALLVTALGLLAYGVRPLTDRRQRLFTACAIYALSLAALWNAAHFYALLARGVIHTRVPVPLSALLCAALAWIAWRASKPPTPLPARHGRLSLTSTIVACIIALPLAQMLFFGKTDYRRHADAIVVFGARAYADGRPSQALADRVRTACDLYHAGYADRLIFSGGPGDGPAVDEPESMRRLALRLGVPDAAITLDPHGLNTDATVRNTDALLRQTGGRRVLAVSHAYHLPRVKMAYRRAGWDVYTVPAEETRPLTQMPYLVAREVAAVWAYYLRPLGGR